MNDYTPEMYEEKYGLSLAKFVLDVKRCGICNTVMLDYRLANRLPFPTIIRMDAKGQLDRAGWRFQSAVKDKDDHPICTVCEAAGLATIVCALCRQERLSSDRQESFGDPPEHLCRQCYETVPAKIWLEKVRHLEEVHAYDFE